MKIAIAIVTVLVIISCGKIDDSYSHIVGDYEWIYSQTNNAAYIANSESSDKYGIRITKKGKLFFYKNGEQTESFDVTDIHQDSYSDFIGVKIDDEDYYIFMRNNEISLNKFPIDIGEPEPYVFYTNNYFLKH